MLPMSKVLEEFFNKLDFLNENVEDYEQKVVFCDDIKSVLEDFDRIYADWPISSRADFAIDFLNHNKNEYKHQSLNDQQEKNGVQVLTVHKAKALEFDYVFIPNMEQGNFPAGNVGGRSSWTILGDSFQKQKDKYTSNLEDEWKLFYVAVTRAKTVLYFYYDLTQKHISQFLVECSRSKYLKLDEKDIQNSEFNR